MIIKKGANLMNKFLFNMINDSIFLSEVKEDGIPIKFTEVNNAACEKLGYSREELLNMSFKDINEEELIANYPQILGKLIKDGKAQFHITHVCKNGKRIPMEINSHTFIRDNKRMILSIARDITDRKAYEEQLNLQKSYFKQLFLNSPEAIAILDKKSSIMDINSGFENLFMFQLEEVVGKKLFELICSKEDYNDPNLLEDFKENKPFVRKEAIRISKDGKRIYVSLLGYPIVNNGERIGSYIIYSDISEKKSYEEDLKIFEKIYNNTLEGVFITDGDVNIKWVNNAFTDITGFAKENVLNEKPSLLSSNKHKQKFYTSMRKEIISKGHWQGEIWNRRKDGTLYLQKTNIIAIKDELGEISHYTAIFSDITKEKEESELVKHLAYHDGLTGINNRMSFIKIASESINIHSNSKKKMALVYADLNNFKNINDIYGHLMGDQVLIKFAEILRKCVRKDDFIARMGGDEFTAILTDIEDKSNTVEIIQRIRDSLKDNLLIKGKNIYLSVSIGVSIYPEDGENLDELMNKADIYMYKEKKSE
jgi:diguanylate cyclase (GGDEF)-like protein/PAS domain S-box-containing protein